MQNSIKASIIIRTYNEEKHIERLLREIGNQQTTFDYEVILVDSGSVDKTIEIASQYVLKIVQVKPDAFSFGHSLNKGIERASGEFCIFISGHCYPENCNWLENLISPFKDSSVALVYGKQRGNSITKYSEKQIFEKWFPDSENGKKTSVFCNNANAAIRKSLWKENKFNEQITGLEDIAWSQKMVSHGYALYYEPKAGVIHIHNEKFSQVYRRYEREAIAMKTIYPHETFSLFDFLKLTTMNILSDYINALQDGVFIKNIFDIPAMRLFQFWGTYRGYNFRRPISGDLRQKFYYPKRPALFNSRNNTEE